MKRFFLFSVLTSLLAVACQPVTPTNTIWYTSSDGRIVEPKFEFGSIVPDRDNDVPDVFGAEIYSNRYTEGRGRLLFKGDVRHLGDNAFRGCTTLTTIVLPDSVALLRAGVFWGCSMLEKVTMPDALQEIGAMAFDGCSSLKSVVLPQTMKRICWGTFNECAALASLAIPDSVIIIENRAFCRCTSLEELTLPAGLKILGHSAFAGCSSLAAVYCKATTPPKTERKRNMFAGNAPGRKIYVPTEAVDAYKSAPGWSDYADDIVGMEF